MKEKEKWVPLKGWENNYLISSNGRIISLERKSKHSRHIGVYCLRKKRKLSFSILNNGYNMAALTINGVVVRKSLHRLVAINFIPNPENKPCVNHKNGVKTDNRVSNLEWATHKENSQHSYRTGLQKPSFGMKGKVGNKNKMSKKVSQLDIKTGKVIKTWDSLHCVTRAKGWAYANIGACALNTRPTAYGYKWAYA